MANYPTSLDTITNPTSGNTLDNPSHSLQHSDANDILEALERKVGIGSSVAGSATLGHALVASTGGTTSWTTIGTAGISSGTATSGQVLTANGSGAVTFSTPTQGLTLINTTSFSAVASQSFNNVFTANYDNYRIVTYITGSSSANIIFRLRASGTDTSTGVYAWAGLYVTASGSPTLTAEFAANATSWAPYFINSTGQSYSGLDLFQPVATNNTSFQNLFNYTTGTTYAGWRNGWINNTTSYDGFSLIASAGTITGQVSVYGYNE